MEATNGSEQREPDTRYCYGARCTWSGPIQAVGTNGSGLPCCPHCRGVLFELPTEAEWWNGAEAFDRTNEPGYLDLMRWAAKQPRCWRTIADLREAYRTRSLYA
jgi:hypothetical protein